jgi:hypothetical protein
MSTATEVSTGDGAPDGIEPVPLPALGDGEDGFFTLSQPLSITVPPAMKVIDPAVRNRLHGGVLKWEAIEVVRAIPEAKFAGVRTVLDANGRGRLFISNGLGAGSVWPPTAGWVTARGFRIKFTNAKTDAEVDTFLANVEAAVI